MGIIKTIAAAWKIASWLRSEKKQMEADIDGYLTEKRAKDWRLKCEKIFRALERGNGNFDRLPVPIKWFFAQTTADNRVGIFGMWFLKSHKLPVHDKVLDEPIEKGLRW